MDTTQLKRNWSKQRDKFKKKFAFLTETDFLFQEGEQEAMFAPLQIKLGKTKEELQSIISSL